MLVVFADTIRKFFFRGLVFVLGMGAAVIVGSVSAQAQHEAAFSKQTMAGGTVSFAQASPAEEALDVLHYDLALTLAMIDEFLGGSMTMLVRLPGAAGSTDRIVVHAAKLQIDSASVNGVLCTVVADTVAENITLIHPGGHLFFGGETLAVRIDYRRLPGVKRPGSRWGYYFFRDTLGIPANLGYTMSEPSDARYWMPCHDEPWDKATADLQITVPSGYVAASNGALVSVVPEPGGSVTWHWREVHPIAPYLMSITASRFTVSTLPFVRAAGDTIPLQYYVWAPDSVETANYLPTVREMVAALSNLFGPYPFDKYGMTAIVPFGYGGMEHQTITTMNRFLKTDERVVLHELAHQWWGNLVTCGTWRDIWLNESFATYSEALWSEYNGGRPALRAYMQNQLLHFNRGSWQGAVYDPVGQGYNLFDDVVYSKGAWVLHTLRGVVGDTTFFRILEAHRAHHSGGNSTTAQFQATVDSVAGVSMDWFFQQWIYGSGWPIYGVAHRWTGDSVVVTITQEQATSWPLYTMPLTLKIHGQTRDSTWTVENFQRVQSYAFALPFIPDSITVDPDGWILKQVVRRVTTVETRDVRGTYSLEQNYPNPFNAHTIIRFSIPAAPEGSAAGVPVALTVVDLLGREVYRFVSERQPPGTSSVHFDGSALSSGVYFYRLQIGGWRETRPMLLLR